MGNESGSNIAKGELWVILKAIKTGPLTIGRDFCEAKIIKKVIEKSSISQYFSLYRFFFF